MELLNHSYNHLIDFLSRNYGKGAYHGDALFRHIYSRGRLEFESDLRFKNNQVFAERIRRDFPLDLPGIRKVRQEKGTLKYTLNLKDEGDCEIFQ